VNRPFGITFGGRAAHTVIRPASFAGYWQRRRYRRRRHKIRRSSTSQSTCSESSVPRYSYSVPQQRHRRSSGATSMNRSSVSRFACSWRP
jgi:hypothetical protein